MGCRRDQKNGCSDWFRKTISQSPMPYKIFLGDGCPVLHGDEIILSVDDSYQRLPWKVQKALKWALSQTDNFTHFIKTDVDSRIWPERFLLDELDAYDYIGNFSDGHSNPTSRSECYAIGAAYCLSRAAAEKIISANVETTIERTTMPPYSNVYAEDAFVGKVLFGMRALHSEQYAANFAGRSYTGPTENLLVLGNSFDNKSPLPLDDFISLDGLTGIKLQWAKDANTRMRAGDSAGACLLEKKIRSSI